MCSHYVAEKARQQLARFGVQLPADWEPGPGSRHIYPTQWAPIVRRPAAHESGDDALPDCEVVLARFGLLPGFAKDEKYGVRTYNARSETVATLASFRGPWAQGRHCIIPAACIYEPDWRSGQHVPTRIARADGNAMGIAGLWQPWKSPGGEWIQSFTMLTINADSHPVFNQLHRPDPKRAPDQQDKRMVVILPEAAYDAWLHAPAAQSMDFLRPYPAEKLLVTREPGTTPVPDLLSDLSD
jgi:putative SOS response-associated peptidase YedK